MDLKQVASYPNREMKRASGIRTCFSKPLWESTLSAIVAAFQSRLIPWNLLNGDQKRCKYADESLTARGVSVGLPERPPNEDWTVGSH